ncbi:hypothetical protein ACFWN7_13175 [Agromyces sp. NPDC058484]|uniref:hypothetical protein n=1 Tax=Agromyces sp. NPDC058484 TaxID=3346524 RepID=UPI003656FF36
MTDKRSAFESPTVLVAPVPVDPAMRRPAATSVGAALVVLRVLAGVLWLAALAFQWRGILAGGVGDSGLEMSSEDLEAAADGALALVLVAGGVVLSVELVLAVLIWFGLNWPRIVVMVFATLSIGGSFVTWWAGDQEITLQTTLLTLSLDILVMLALSSRAARAYARRPRPARHA